MLVFAVAFGIVEQRKQSMCGVLLMHSSVMLPGELGALVDEFKVALGAAEAPNDGMIFV